MIPFVTELFLVICIGFVYNYNIILKGAVIMKKLITAILISTFIILSLCSFTPVKSVEAKEEKFETVAFDKNKVLEKRFLNMLNHNFVYNENIYDDEALLNNSALALLNLASDGFIEEIYIKDYVFNMYGKIFDSLLEYNEGLPKYDGYFYVIPRGYDLYEHSNAVITANEDGSYTVVTDVVIDYHFGEKVEAVCTTLFLPNELSQFGFNILYSDIAYPLEYAMAI